MRTPLLSFTLLSLALLTGCGERAHDSSGQGSPEVQNKGRNTEQNLQAEPPSAKNLVGQAEGGMPLATLLTNANPKTSVPNVGYLELPNQQRIPVRWVGVWQDEKATNEKEFAISLGRAMRSLSATTGNEFCAKICKQNDVWGAAILTINSGRYCPSLAFCPGSGWTFEGQNIHSHRRSGSYEMSETDKLLRQGTMRPDRTVNLEAERASKEDMEAGGWIVGQDGLWLLDDKGEAEAVWDYQREQAGMPARFEVQPQ